MQPFPPPQEETEEVHDFESRFSFSHDLPSPLPRVVTAFVCSPWSADCKSKKRRAPLPPSIQYLKGVKNSALHVNGVYDMISIQALAHNWLPSAPNPPRLVTFTQEEDSTQGAAREPSMPATQCEPAPRIYLKLAPRTSKAKEESLKARKNKSHSSIIRRKTETAASGSLREKKIPRDPTYEEIDDYFDHNHNINELAEIVGEKLDTLLNKPIVSESCASLTKNRQRKAKSFRDQKNSPESRRGPRDSKKGKGADEATAKENVKNDDCASGIYPDTVRRGSGNKQPLGERESDRAKGNVKTYIFGGISSEDSGKRQRALKERQRNLAAPSQPSSGGRQKAAEDSRTNSTDKKSKAVASPSVKTSFKATARRYKDTVFHTYKKRHKRDKSDTLTGTGRHFFHQIPRIVITCENWLTDYEKGSSRSRSLGKLRASFRKLPIISHASEAKRSPHCTEDTPRSEDYVEGERRRRRPHSSCDYVRPTSPERANATQPQPKTPNRDSPSLSDDMYVRRKSRSRRDDLAKMR